MKIKPGFFLREIADTWVVVPIGQRVVEFNGLMSLSESGALLWKRLEDPVEKEEELVKLLEENYKVDTSTAAADVKEFLNHIMQKGFMEQ
ncbi:PqqD family protein [Anaerocolumna sp. AGMB13025]|uniref:PqqD family protein n=1 Tax=Anaerocolumna sp. AGMB13025 TaxID=3039116 RepID=UPI00241D0940|nr:PqqD family protein [Anaerocolumna sp. AGMB13025]WFR57886.1 PqqD family protein [Anaerocolumna sp. AGMB13025]